MLTYSFVETLYGIGIREVQQRLKRGQAYPPFFHLETPLDDCNTHRQSYAHSHSSRKKQRVCTGTFLYVVAESINWVLVALRRGEIFFHSDLDYLNPHATSEDDTSAKLSLRPPFTSPVQCHYLILAFLGLKSSFCPSYSMQFSISPLGVVQCY